MEGERDRGQVAGDEREPRPQTTDRLGEGGRKIERGNESETSQMDSIKQATAEWEAKFSSTGRMADIDWARMGGRGQRQQGKEKEVEEEGAASEWAKIARGTFNAQTRHRLTITLSPSIYTHPPPPIVPATLPYWPLSWVTFPAMQTGKRKTERKTQGKMWTESFSFCRVRWPMTMTTMTVPANTLCTQIDTDTGSDNQSAHVGRPARLRKYPASA